MTADKEKFVFRPATSPPLLARIIASLLPIRSPNATSLYAYHPPPIKTAGKKSSASFFQCADAAVRDGASKSARSRRKAPNAAMMGMKKAFGSSPNPNTTPMETDNILLFSPLFSSFNHLDKRKAVMPTRKRHRQSLPIRANSKKNIGRTMGYNMNPMIAGCVPGGFSEGQQAS